MMSVTRTLLIILIAIQAKGYAFQEISKGNTLSLNTIDSILKKSQEQYRYLINNSSSKSLPRTFEDGKLKSTDPGGWVSGFYPGSLIYLYQDSGDTLFWKEAQGKLQLLEQEQYNTHTHDLGFMMYCSFGNALKIKPVPKYEDVLINSARSLSSRYSEKVESIRSWDSDDAYKVIIDNMMNLELLFWATRKTGDSSFYNIAVAHANTTLKNHFREDFSSYHVVDYDPETGEVISRHTHQGLRDSSAWARGQAWGLYGFTMLYRETGDEKYLEQARQIAEYIINNPYLPDDHIPLWDYNVTDPNLKYRDASAAAISSSALLELVHFVEPMDKSKYMEFVEKTLTSLISPKYFSNDGENGGFLLKHNVGNLPANSEINVPLSYADYYFIEALLRYKAYLKNRVGERNEIIERARSYLVQNGSSDISPAINTFEFSTGSWKDINYSGNEMAGWEPQTHLNRILKLSLAWSDGSSEFYHQDKILKVIESAINFWFKNKFQSSNWWHNEIGVPQTMRDIVLLMRKGLKDDSLNQALSIMAQYKIYGSGANLIWSADIAFHYGLLTEDYNLMNEAMSLIQDEVKISQDNEGIQPDYSFHQHGPRLQIYHYGKSFLKNNIKLAWEVRDTQWKYSDSKLDILKNFLLQGWQWMARGENTVPETLDRAASRENSLREARLPDIASYFSEVLPGSAKEFQQFEQNQNIDTFSLTGFKYYPYSDIAIYHQRNFSFFLKTISERTCFSESINNENLKGLKLNSGDTYFIKSGSEYYNSLPLWNWEMIPGTSGFDDAGKMKKPKFSGSVGDNSSGITAMKYRQTKERDSANGIDLKKSWAVNQNIVVSLISPSKMSKIKTFYTTMNQSFLRGDVYVNDPFRPLKEGSRFLKNVKWIYHDGFVYIPIHSSNRIYLHNDFSRGRWFDINHSGSRESIEEKMFLLAIYSKTNRSGGYIVASCHSPTEADRIFKKQSWEIIQNTNTIQSIEFSDGTLMSAHYKSNVQQDINQVPYTVSVPCLVLKNGSNFYVSDPSHQGLELTIRFNNQMQTMDLPKNGTSVKMNFEKV